MNTQMGSEHFELDDTADELRDIDLPSAEATYELEVCRDDDARVYTASTDGHVIAVIRYDVVDGRVVIVSTVVEAEFRGRGIADELIGYALDDIRSLGMRVIVYCPTVARFIADNAQFTDLLDPVYPGR
jgi:predicted GNAT family acetyltransferase